MEAWKEMQKRIILFILLFSPFTAFAAGEGQSLRGLADEIYRLAQEMVHHGGEGHTDEVVQYGEKIVARIETATQKIRSSALDKKAKEASLLSLKSIRNKVDEAIRAGRHDQAKAALSAAKDTLLQAKKFRQAIQALPSPLPVVVTLPVLKDFVEEVGQDNVSVHSLITGLENEHTYTPRPSDMRLLQQAGLFVTIGLGLDGWMEPLIKNADAHFRRVVASSHVPLIAYSSSSSSKQEMQHQRANVSIEVGAPTYDPHIWLDPENAIIMIRNITEGLIEADPIHREAYRHNEARFIRQLEQMMDDLKAKMSGLSIASRKIITHHQGWSYFAMRFGFEIAGEILTHVETEGGADPSAKRMGELVRLLKREKIGVIVSEPQYNPKIPEALAKEAGARIVTLSLMPGTSPNTKHYLDLIRYNVETVVAALQNQNNESIQ